MCAYPEQLWTEERSWLRSFGQRIRALRKERGLTLDQLAELSGSSKSYIWELENKNPPRPSAEKIAKIAAALDTTGDYLFGGKQAETKETAEDWAFFRKYQSLDPNTKATIKQMMDVIRKRNG